MKSTYVFIAAAISPSCTLFLSSARADKGRDIQSAIANHSRIYQHQININVPKIE